jgi:3-oxo-5-alpha-steroid 4-dehydrogenase 1
VGDRLYLFAVASLAVAAAVTFPLLFAVTAPYGRHLRAGWGPTLDARLGWLLMEAPSPLLCLSAFAIGGGLRAPWSVWLLLGLYQLHYLYRSFVFPFRLKGGTRKPWLTVGLAFLFSVLNGSANGWGLARFAAPAGPWLALGVGLFVVGWAINQHADAVLLGLRGPGETGYRIPRGGLYRWVSCPNYLGEILEWLGFALAAGTAAAGVFALFTAANLVPRAASHHRWYRETFDDYPEERRALLPFLW